MDYTIYEIPAAGNPIRLQNFHFDFSLMCTMDTVLAGESPMECGSGKKQHFYTKENKILGVFLCGKKSQNLILSAVLIVALRKGVL